MGAVGDDRRFEATDQGGGVWRLVAGSRLAWREIDGQWLVYDSGSGQTHLLEPLVAAVLGLLEAQDCGVADLCAAIREGAPEAEPADVCAGLLAALDALCQAGLVEVLSPGVSA